MDDDLGSGVAFSLPLPLEDSLHKYLAFREKGWRTLGTAVEIRNPCKRKLLKETLGGWPILKLII
jgi:hypothetical protein